MVLFIDYTIMPIFVQIFNQQYRSSHDSTKYIPTPIELIPSSWVEPGDASNSDVFARVHFMRFIAANRPKLYYALYLLYIERGLSLSHLTTQIFTSVINAIQSGRYTRFTNDENRLNILYFIWQIYQNNKN